MDVSSLQGWLKGSHIAAGFLGLVVFWIPLLVRKGGRLHVVCGRIFAGCAAVVIATALVACGWRLIDPIGFFSPADQPPADHAAEFARQVRLFAAFLGAVAVYTLVPLVLAVRAVRTRRDPAPSVGPGIRLLIWSEAGVSVGLAVYASALLMSGQADGFAVIVLAVGPFGLGAAWWHLRSVARPRPIPMFWWYKHMEFMLTTGIGFHTAFAVFGLKSWLGALGTGPWAMVPWVVPAAVGVPAVWLWVRHYRRKFGEATPAALRIADPTQILAEPPYGLED